MYQRWLEPPPPPSHLKTAYHYAHACANAPKGNALSISQVFLSFQRKRPLFISPAGVPILPLAYPHGSSCQSNIYWQSKTKTLQQEASAGCVRSPASGGYPSLTYTRMKTENTTRPPQNYQPCVVVVPTKQTRRKQARKTVHILLGQEHYCIYRFGRRKHKRILAATSFSSHISCLCLFSLSNKTVPRTTPPKTKSIWSRFHPDTIY